MATRREIELKKEKDLHDKLDKILNYLEDLKKMGIPPSKKAATTRKSK